MISDASLKVWVNDQQATVSANGQWQADNVNFMQIQMMHPFNPGFHRPGYQSNIIIYLTVSAFKEKTMIATQRFEISP
jgi:hypothetical protein